MDSMVGLLRGTVSERTMRLYEESWGKYVRWCGASDKDMWSGSTPMLWRTNLVEEGLAASSVNRHLSAIKAVFKVAYTQSMVSMDTWQRVKLTGGASERALRSRKRTPSPLPTPPQLWAMVNACPDTTKGSRDKAILSFMLSTGCRTQELTQVKVSDLDFGNNRAWVMGKKDSAPRAVPLNQETKIRLTEWLWNRGNQEGPLFNSFDGRSTRISQRAMSNQAVYNLIRQAGNRVGMQKVSPHDMRRVVATSLASDNIAKAKQVLGHAHIATTQKYVRKLDLPNVDVLGYSE